ncbi:MAG TPA: MerR family transcriptional regulator [Segeticoccus sp.]|uniref:MerR family transcriptional regulator n=1 Tax=Segeticoccus sp. TaxID=2706531 RepID=UPI002D7EE866|nr:MerR family transcriptional regulator [Segeticoccus sp.]HET8601185.1 MerR family transcriptional regulator [Segeticoccus sp.]
MSASEQGGLRIGALSSRVGLSAHTLRAWESRYGVLEPVRSAGGYRLYTRADEARVQRMKTLVAGGLAPAQAAQVVLADPPDATQIAAPETPAGTRDHVGVEAVTTELRRALDAFDEPAAQAVLDRALDDLSLSSVLRGVVVPYLADLGDRWEQGTATVAQEHFASNVLRGRLAGLARGWGAGSGPRAVLACPPGELHDLTLLVFGIVLARHGWVITYLGTSTPVEELAGAVEATSPALVVVAGTDSARFEQVAAELAALAGRSPLALAGAGATAWLAGRLGARLLDGDPVTQAELVGATR